MSLRDPAPRGDHSHNSIRLLKTRLPRFEKSSNLAAIPDLIENTAATLHVVPLAATYKGAGQRQIKAPGGDTYFVVPPPKRK